MPAPPGEATQGGGQKGWLESATRFMRRLGPEEETRQRMRYFLYELLAENLPRADDAHADNTPPECVLTSANGGRE